MSSAKAPAYNALSGCNGLEAEQINQTAFSALLLIAALAGRPIPGETTKPVAIDAAEKAGIYFITRSWSAAVGDLDQNGWPDVLLGVHGDGPARLYRNDTGRFTEIDVGSFVDNDRHDCAWGDANRDGRPDVYCTVGADSGHGRGKNELWIQQTDQTFVDEAEAFGVMDEFGRGRRTTFIDVNHDTYPDLFVGNQFPRSDGNLSPNRLFINQGGSSFRDAIEYGLEAEQGALCVQAADFNSDGWDDLLVCGQQPFGMLLFLNEVGQHFAEVSGAVGIEGFAPSARLADLDRDGLLDLAHIDRDSVKVQLQRAGAFEKPITVHAGMPQPRWIAVGDVNRDAALDLYVVQTCGKDLATNYPDLMLLNNGRGTRFVESPIPQATEGCGDIASPIDFDRNGTTDFVVMNGYGQNPGFKAEGPVQLISFKGPP